MFVDFASLVVMLVSCSLAGRLRIHAFYCFLLIGGRGHAYMLEFVLLQEVEVLRTVSNCGMGPGAGYYGWQVSRF